MNIVIEVYGGCISAVHSDTPGITVHILDRDNVADMDDAEIEREAKESAGYFVVDDGMLEASDKVPHQVY